MNQRFFTTLMLLICMVFSTTASAFLHVNEHHHEQSLGEHYHSADSHQHDTGNSTSADHAHHFNLHVVGDIVDHKPITLAHAFSVTSCEYSSQLISRTDSPPLPPPNA